MLLVSQLTKSQMLLGRSSPIHREPPALEEQSGKTEILETGIKVIDLIAPIAKGGKVGLFGGAGVGKTVSYSGTYCQHCS